MKQKLEQVIAELEKKMHESANQCDELRKSRFDQLFAEGSYHGQAVGLSIAIGKLREVIASDD